MTLTDLADRCAATCKWPRCTGLGDTDQYAHECPSRPDVQRDPVACTVCGETPARLYPRGWRCREHTPPVPTPDPALTAEALATRGWHELFASFRQHLYGPARELD